MADFASRLRELRNSRGLRQKDLAQQLGLAQTTIANYEQKSRFPDEGILGRIADYFNTSLAYLLGRTLAKLPALRYPTTRALAEDLDDVREGRPPRHRPGWVDPPRHELPLAEIDTAREVPTSDLSGPSSAHSATTSVTRQTVPPRGPAGRVLAGAVALVALMVAVSRQELEMDLQAFYAGHPRVDDHTVVILQRVGKEIT